MQTLQLSAQRPSLAVRTSVRRSSVRCAAQTSDASAAAAPSGNSKAAPSGNGKAAEIYIGHEKEDYASKRVGEKGRFIVDDPSKYPARESDQLSGGWAGGEAGLKAAVAAWKREEELNGPPPAKKKWSKFDRTPQPIAKGDDVLYMGNGNVIKDDGAKYPTRNELTGGFAGGELGLSIFKERGDVPVAPEGQGTKQSSPLITAFVLGLAATGGGLLLSTVEEVGFSVAEGSTATASLGLDDRTKAMLTAGILLVGVIGTVAGAQVLVDTMANKVKAGASKLAILGGFWMVVFLAAKLVLQS